jgi:poly(A) polymerase
MQPRFEQRAGQRPFRLLEHPRFRAAYDFLWLRGHSGEIPVEIADWWERFQHADTEERERMLRPDEAPKKKRRRSRGRGRRDSGATIDSPDVPSSSSEH